MFPDYLSGVAEGIAAARGDVGPDADVEFIGGDGRGNVAGPPDIGTPPVDVGDGSHVLAQPVIGHDLVCIAGWIVPSPEAFGVG